MSIDKQTEIEKMAKDMCEYYYEGTCYQDKKPCDCKCDIFTDAQYLYSKGYRKSTYIAEEIFAEIEKYLVTGSTLYGQPIRSIAVGTFARLKKKYIGKDKMREPKECEGA